ncbi:MAG: tetratricopeptide repeat protein [Bacteroidetes bacterium]|nr:tetratricopeptide repeat protein [Bacteroidota bacterium]
MIRLPGVLLIILLLSPLKDQAQDQDPAGEMRSLMESCQFSQAITMAELFLLHDSTRTDLFLLKGSALSALFRYDEAITALRNAQKLDSTNIRVFNELATVYRLSGDHGKAIETIEKVLRIDPGNRYFILQMANLCYQEKKFRETVNILLQVYYLDTLDFFVIKQLANCYEELKLSDSAEFFCRQALKIIPFDPFVTGKLANILIRENEINTAFFLTALFLKKDPVNIPILKQNAYCNYLLLDFKSSARQFWECIKHGDSSKFAKKYLGLSYYKQEKYDSAAPLLRRAFYADTTDAEVCFYYAVSESRSHGNDTALVYFQRTLGLLMPSGQFLSTLYAELGGAYTLTSHPDTALFLLRKAFDINPHSNILRFKIAYQYDYYLHKPLEALPYYREFLKNAPPPPSPENTIPQQASTSGYMRAGSQEITIPYTEYARNRIREITKH